MLYSDRLNSSEFRDYVCVVSVPYLKNEKGIDNSISGLLDADDITLSMGDSPGGSLVGGAIESVGKDVLNKASNFVGSKRGGGLVGDGLRGVVGSTRSVLSTFKSYGGSTDVSFSVSMHIFRDKFSNGSFKDVTTRIARLTQPETDSNLSGRGLYLKSYLYDPGIKSLTLTAFKGALIHVTVGDWFHASGLFCTSSNTKLSKHVDKDGKPLFMVWDAIFTPYKALNASELSDFVRC